MTSLAEILPHLQSDEEQKKKKKKKRKKKKKKMRRKVAIHNRQNLQTRLAIIVGEHG